MKGTRLTTTAVWLGMVCTGVSAPEQGSFTLDDVVIPEPIQGSHVSVSSNSR